MAYRRLSTSSWRAYLLGRLDAVTAKSASGERLFPSYAQRALGYARVSSTGQDLEVQLEKLKGHKMFKEKRSGVDAGRPELKRCLDLRVGDTLLTGWEVAKSVIAS